jgi:hypothetical protein
VAIGIAKIDADPAARPVRAAFDCDVELAQARLPFLQFVGRDGECDVVRPAPVMGRDDAGGHPDGVQRFASAEQQQHAAPADVIGAHPLIGIDGVERKQPFVEGAGAFEVVDIENGLQHPF